MNGTPPAPLDVWISIGSTYAYLTVMRLEEAAKTSGVPLSWRPFDTRALMLRQQNIPFAGKPSKANYMWRDIERRAAARGLTPRIPAPYPLADLARANRVALIGTDEGWAAAYIRETYRRWFELGDPAGEEPNLSTSLEALGLSPQPILAAADSAETEARLAAETDKAEAAGVFGVPTFITRGEVFWGDDRLEDALQWAQHGAPTS